MCWSHWCSSAVSYTHLDVYKRQTGTYAAASDRTLLIESPQPRVRLVVVTSGVGASTGFAIGEEVIGDLYG